MIDVRGWCRTHELALNFLVDALMFVAGAGLLVVCAVRPQAAWVVAALCVTCVGAAVDAIMISRTRRPAWRPARRGGGG
jgi:uncharacterized membrane protein SirB2